MAKDESPPEVAQEKSTLERVVRQLSTADPQSFYLLAHWFEQAMNELEDVRSKLTKYQRMLDEAWHNGEKQQHSQVSGAIRHIEQLVSAVRESDYPKLFRQVGDAVSESKRRLHDLQTGSEGAKTDGARGDLDQRATKVLEDLASSYRQFGGMLAPLPERTVLSRLVVHDSPPRFEEVPAARTGHEYAPVVASASGSSARAFAGSHERSDVAVPHAASATVASGQSRAKDPVPFARFSRYTGDRVSGEVFSEEAAPVAAMAFAPALREQPRAAVLGRARGPAVSREAKESAKAGTGREIAAANGARPIQLTTTAGPGSTPETSPPAKTVPGDLKVSDVSAARSVVPQALPTVQLLGAPLSQVPASQPASEQVRSQMSASATATASLASGPGLQVRPVAPLGAESLLTSGSSPAVLSAATSAGAGANASGVPVTSLLHGAGSAPGAAGPVGRPAASVWLRAEAGSWTGSPAAAGRRGGTGDGDDAEWQDVLGNAGVRKEKG